MIIGKGGSQIKDIQSSTGAQVKVRQDEIQSTHFKIPDANPGANEREVTVSGTDDQIQRAIDQINQIVLQVSDRKKIRRRIIIDKSNQNSFFFHSSFSRNEEALEEVE